MHSLACRALTRLLHEPELRRSALAQSLRAHPTNVSRYFHGDIGLTLAEYRTRLRLLRFIAAVDESGSSLLTAACLAGFGSDSQCHRAFRATLGCSPRKFFGSERRRIETAWAPW